MAKKKHFQFTLPAEEEMTGILKWFQRLQNQWRPLFSANIIAVLSLTPGYYAVNYLLSTGDLMFWLAAVVLLTLASPSLLALSRVCAMVALGKPVWVKDVFVTSWKKEWKMAMGLGLLWTLLWSVLVYSVYLVIAVDGGIALPMLLGMLLCAYLLTGVTLFSFQQAAMLQLAFSQVLKNAFLLIFAGKWRSVFAILLVMLMVLVCAVLYEFASLILLIGYLALMVMTFDLIFAPVFSRLFLSEEQHEEETV